MSLTALYVSACGCVPSGSFQNVDGGVVISIQRQATRTRDPAIFQGEPFKESATVRAGLRGIGGVHKYHLTASTRSLAREKFCEYAPSGIQDTLTEVFVTNHVGDLQILHTDHVEMFNQSEAQLMGEVTPLIGNMGMLALNLDQFLATIAPAFLLALKRTLQDTQSFLGRTIIVRMIDFRTFARRDERGDAHVNPNRRSASAMLYR